MLNFIRNVEFSAGTESAMLKFVQVSSLHVFLLDAFISDKVPGKPLKLNVCE